MLITLTYELINVRKVQINCNEGRGYIHDRHVGTGKGYIVVNVSPASMKVRPALLQPEGRKSMWQGAIPPETRETKESKEEACANV